MLLFVPIGGAVPPPLLASGPRPGECLEEAFPGHLLATPADRGRARACAAAAVGCPLHRRLQQVPCRVPPHWTIAAVSDWDWDWDWDRQRPLLWSWWCRGGEDAVPLAFSSLER